MIAHVPHLMYREMSMSLRQIEAVVSLACHNWRDQAALGRHAGDLGEFECLNAPAAAAKRQLIVLSAAGLENGLSGFTPASARNALERENVLALSAAVQAPFRPRHN